MPLPLTPDVDLPASRATLFPETRTSLDSTNLPTRAAGYPLSLSSRPPADGTACLSAGGATASVNRAPDPMAPKRRPTTRSIFDCDTTSARHVHHRDCRRSHLFPHCLPLDVSVQLGTLAKWEGAARPRELAVAALPRVDPPSMTPRRRTGRCPGPVTHVLRRLDAEGARALVEDCPKLRCGLSLPSRANRRRCSAGSSTNPYPEVPSWLSSRLRSPPSLFGVARLARRRSSMSPSAAHDLLLAQVDYLPPDHPSQQPSVVGAIAALASRRPTSFIYAGLALAPSRSLSRSPSRPC